MLKLVGCLKNYIWGGEKLQKYYGKADGAAAESWEISVHPDGPCKISFCDSEKSVGNVSADFPSTLADYLSQHRGAVDPQGLPMPILVKFIDAAKNLSVQVHPNDAYARLHENDHGKTEMWYVIAADKGAGVYCGFKHNTGKSEFLQKVADGTVEQLLNFIPVKSGDCFLIKAGTVHAICAGCFICEVQQSSNTTYRVYDYNRSDADGKPRLLQVKKAVEVIDFNAFHDETNSRVLCNETAYKMRLLTCCEYFCSRELTLKDKYSETNETSFTAVNVIKGEGVINGQKFSAGDSFFVDCGEKLQLGGNATILLTTKPEEKSGKDQSYDRLSKI